MCFSSWLITCYVGKDSMPSVTSYCALYEGKVKSSSLAYNDVKLGTNGCWLGTRTGAGVTATLVYSFFGCSPWLHEHWRQHTSIKLYTSVVVTSAPGTLAAAKLYTRVVVTPAPGTLAAAYKHKALH